MDSKDMEKQIIESYKKDESMMILVFAQWCINHDLDPFELYKKAYPDQERNPALEHAMTLTVSKDEAGDIAYQTVLNVLALYGNDALAYVVTEVYEELIKNKKKQS